MQETQDTRVLSLVVFNPWVREIPWKGEGWRKGFSNPVYKAHTNLGLALELHGVKIDPTKTAKALRTENHHP